MILLTHLELILTGLGLGLLISAPVGPVNILCIQRTLIDGFWAGFAVGIGAICADMVISTMAALGISALSGVMQTYQNELRLIGGAILIGFGVKIAVSHPKFKNELPQRQQIIGYAGVIPQSFLLTITNPGAFLGIFAVFGSVGTAIGGLNGYVEAGMILIGLLCGASLWWFGLTRLISALRDRMNERRLFLINQVAGGILILCGLGLIGQTLLN